MAAGEYVSVSSQSDTEQADLTRERTELSQNVAFEREELAQIYVQHGVEAGLARQVAQQLMARDALGAHAQLGISEIIIAHPFQAVLTSAVTFAVGAVLNSADGAHHARPLPGGCRLTGVARVSSAFGSSRRKGRRSRRRAGHRPGDILGSPWR